MGHAGHSVRVHRLTAIAFDKLLHAHTTKALLLRYGAILMGDEDGLEVDNLFSETRNLLAELIILLAEKFNFRLQICKPLLLALSTFQSSNPI